MTEPWEDVNEQVKADWKEETTPFERVYEIVEQTHDGQSAAEIAGPCPRERADGASPLQDAREYRVRGDGTGWSNNAV
jgi:hypothetical protein